MPTLKKKLLQRSDRVKSVDMHPTEPWVLCGLYSGKAVIYNYTTQALVKSFDVSEHPVRCAKFITRKQWIIVGSDDMQIRVFNYNTQERISQFEGHQDYIRYIEVHPTQPYIISTSDDMTAKLWDWERNWSCIQTYEGHAHYVMMARFNPKDTNTFATASLDRSVKVWSLTSQIPNFSLEGHERGVNCVDYYPGGDKPYIVSGADDQTLRVWDYQTRSCVSVLEGHTHNVCAVAFHPRLPFILSGGEDGTIRVWHNTTYRLDSTLSYGLERAWTIGVNAANNKVALGFDDGTIVVKLGKEVPIASMDKNGKIIMARNNIVYSTSVRVSSASIDDGFETGNTGSTASSSSSTATTFVDGERLILPEKELGSVELFPQQVAHNPNGRFVCVSGDSEFVIYTAQVFRNKTFGTALDFVWSSYGIGNYGIRENTSKVKLFRDFKEVAAFRPSISADGISGGALFCVRSSDTICFYDWETGTLVRRIEVPARTVYWNDEGTLVAIASDDSLFVLKYNREVAAAAIANGGPEIAEEGVEAAFELQHEVSEKVRSGIWVGDCFIFTNSNNRLNYYVGGEVITFAHLDRRMYLLGYLAKEGRVFLIDKTNKIVSYGLNLSVLEYQTAVVRRDFAAANRVLADVPHDQHNNIAKFLEGQGFKEEALAVADDPDLKFDLALQLNKLDVAYTLLHASTGTSTDGSSDSESIEVQSKWKQLMDLALATSNISLAEECALTARDLGALLLIYSSTANVDGMQKVAQMAIDSGKDNVAFLAYFSIGMTDKCQALLESTGRSFESLCMSEAYGTQKPSSPSSSSASSAPTTVVEDIETATNSNPSTEDTVVPTDTNSNSIEKTVDELDLTGEDNVE